MTYSWYQRLGGINTIGSRLVSDIDKNQNGVTDSLWAFWTSDISISDAFWLSWQFWHQKVTDEKILASSPGECDPLISPLLIFDKATDGAALLKVS